VYRVCARGSVDLEIIFGLADYGRVSPESLAPSRHYVADNRLTILATDEQPLECRPAVTRPTSDIGQHHPTPQAFTLSRSDHGNFQPFRTDRHYLARSVH
jgi:hypothetical protein